MRRSLIEILEEEKSILHEINFYEKQAKSLEEITGETCDNYNDTISRLERRLHKIREEIKSYLSKIME